MNSASLQLFATFGLFIILLFIAGIYCILMTRNLMRALIGLELLTKAVTLLLIVAGYVTGAIGLAQALAITLIIIEVVVIAITAGVIIGIFRCTDSIDRKSIMDLKG